MYQHCRAKISCGLNDPILFFSMFLDHFRDALKGPINLLTGDNERWRDANHAVMRLLAQDSFFFQRFAIGTRCAVEFDADPHAPAANLS